MRPVGELLGIDGELKPEVVDRAKALIMIIAELCRNEEPAIALYVLEAALTEQITMFVPPLGDLFRSMMRAYKQKASALISLVEMLKENGVSLADLEALKEEGSLNDLITEAKKSLDGI